jgi:signal peptidase I
MKLLAENAGKRVFYYNAIVLMKIIGRPTWWTYFYSIINSIMFPVIWIETLKVLEKSSLDTFE